MQSLALEVAIGMALVFLITSLLVSAANEIASRSLNIRSKALWTRLDELMAEGGGTEHSLGYSFILKGIRTKVRPTHKRTPNPPNPGKGKTLEAFANTGSIHALDYVKTNRKTKVWKISGDVFASAVAELAAAKGGEGSLEEQITSLADDSDLKDSPLGVFLYSTGKELAKDADTFINGTGRWFDGQMEVLSNTYRRNVRLILGVIGLFVALFFNVNALTIGQQLAENAALRQSAVVIADQVNAKDFTDCKDEKKGEEQYTCAAKQIALFTDAGVLIPIQDGYGEAMRKVWTKPGTSTYDYGVLVLGIGITAVAVSFGGPFWFDFLRFLTGARKQLN